MLLSDCRSYLLLPRFVQNEFMESLCGAVDELIHELAARCNALPCETSANALTACRDDELAQIADDLGVIPYYPDLPRATRENIILKAKTWTRYAGTVGSVVEMVNALFNTNHTTIDDALDDAFKYHIDIDDNSVESTEVNFKRFNECIEMLGHTTTTPDGFTFHYEGTFEINATAVSGDVLVWIDTKSVCMPVPKNRICGVITTDSDYSVEIDIGKRLINGTISFTGELRENVMPESGRVTLSGMAINDGTLTPNTIPDSGVIEEWVNNSIELDLGFSYSPGNDIWRVTELYSGNPEALQPISQTDADNLTTFGLQLQTWGLSYEGPYGHLGIGNTAFTYDVICLYAGLNSGGGSNPISVDPTDFSVIARGWPSTDGMYLTCGSRYNDVRGCRMKITKPDQ